MSFLKLVMKSIDLKRNGLSFFLLIISVFLSLSAFFRFLQFNQTGYLGKVFIFIPLFLFFLFLLLEFCPPVINLYINRRNNIIVTICAIIAVTLVFYLAPYQFTPFRTLHKLTIAVPDTSSPVILQKITDSTGNSIAVNDFNGLTSNGFVTIQPGNAFSLEREMTGGVTIFVTASQIPGVVAVNWDGVISHYDIPRVGIETKIVTKASSWGDPNLSHKILAYINLISDWVSCVFLLFGVIRLGIGMISKKKLSLTQSHFINPNFLLIQFTLLIGGGLIINLPTSPKVLLYFLIGISLFLWVLLFALGNSKKNIPWAYILSQFSAKKNQPISFLLTLSIFTILANLIFIPFIPLFGNPTKMYTKPINNTLTDLLVEYSKPAVIALTIDFYKQLDGANIIISERIRQSIELNTDSFSIRNRLSSITVQEYPDRLNEDQAEAIMIDDRLISYRNPQSEDGFYRLLETSNNNSRTYIFFQFQNDLFIIPENYPVVGLP